ncbi:MAG: sigma-70 family RNA polymerase sigma factor [Planctomycetaceae bacterium]|nr:sigma-70 family RNA polymerase sigma factor [Planctomycetaceae bacterium]
MAPNVALAANQLLPVVYDELRKLAARKMSEERPDQTLQATALVHEAFIRLVNAENAQEWNSRGHFFTAAAEAMRRILVENARHKRRLKHGGDRVRDDVELPDIQAPEPREDLIALDAALDRLKLEDPAAAQLVQLRYFARLTLTEAAEAMNISPRTADRTWAYAKAWLHRELS